MTVSAGTIISILALIVSIVLMIWNIRKDSKKESSDNVASMTTVIVKLENIGRDISEIKNDLRSVKADVRDHGERIARNEQKIKDLEKIVKMYHHCDNISE